MAAGSIEKKNFPSFFQPSHFQKSRRLLWFQCEVKKEKLQIQILNCNGNIKVSLIFMWWKWGTFWISSTLIKHFHRLYGKTLDINYTVSSYFQSYLKYGVSKKKIHSQYVRTSRKGTFFSGTPCTSQMFLTACEPF